MFTCLLGTHGKQLKKGKNSGEPSSSFDNSHNNAQKM